MAMLELEDIVNVTFHKASFGGYKPDDVENFIGDVEETVNYLVNENNNLTKTVEELTESNEAYKAEEKSVKATLVKAQRLANKTVTEAREKAEKILNDANEKAQATIEKANNDIVDQVQKMEEMQREVVQFRTSLLDLYKEHLKLIDAIPKEVIFETLDKEENDVLAISEFDNPNIEEEVDKKLAQIKSNLDLDDLDDMENMEDAEDIDDMDEENEFVSESTNDDFEFFKESKTIKFDAIKLDNDLEDIEENDE